MSFHTDDDKPTHKLIIGDNYQALQNLLIQYKNKINVIYIDPPYAKDRMGEFAKTNYNNALTRDNLLSMLYPRLQLAKQLLDDDGVIFCSIDDKNQAYVKCLFDEVFGEENFIASAPRKTGAGDAATNSDSELRKPYDYVLIYSKSKKITKLRKKVVGEKEYPYEDEHGKYSLAEFQASGSDATRKARPKLYYPIYINSDSSLSLEKTNQVYKEILPSKVNGEDGRWMWSKEKFSSDSNLFLTYDNKSNKIKRKVYHDENKDQTVYQVEKAYFDEETYFDEEYLDYSHMIDLFDKSSFRNASGTNALKTIIEQKCFDNPKPVELIKHLISLNTSNSLILDFFAGSGTTGHSVLELNRQDGGNRTFILCQINEPTDNTPNGIAYDVTSKRLKRIMTGKCYDGTTDFKWLKDNEPYGGNLDVYEIENVANFETSEGKTPFDVIDETLYGMEKFTKLREKVKWVCSNFEKTQKYFLKYLHNGIKFLVMQFYLPSQ